MEGQLRGGTWMVVVQPAKVVCWWLSEMVGWGENRGQVVVLVSGLMENSGLVENGVNGWGFSVGVEVNGVKGRTKQRNRGFGVRFLGLGKQTSKGEEEDKREKRGGYLKR